MARPPAISKASRGPRAMDLLDEAVTLLRATPLALYFIYYLGAAPFCLALIYFEIDMTENARAEEQLVPLALGLTVLYLWMKTCQAVFARRLLERLEGGQPEPWSVARWANTALVQAVFAGTQLLLYPAAIVISLPFAWVNAFYHSVSIVGTGRRSTLRESMSEAGKLAVLWPRQNWLIVGIQLVAMLALFANMGAMLAMIPELLDIFFGITTVFDQNRFASLNSSFYLEVFLLCFLVMNPVSKAVFVLRCFYGRARLDGADLRAELRFHQRERSGAAPVRALALAAILLVPGIAWADTNAAPVAAATPSAETSSAPPPVTAKLDDAIEKTLQKDEFAWRMPKPAVAEDDNGLVARMLRSLAHFREWVFHKLDRILTKVLHWVLGKEGHQSDGKALSALASVPWRGIFIFAAIVVVLLVAFLVLRHFRGRISEKDVAATSSPVATVDLEAEDIRADQLPEGSWLALAQELMGKGELRLALRAFYLATLSILAHSELIRLGAAKSNRDYLTEMTRRLRENGEAVPVFRDSIRLFEASWYGTHDVTGEVLGKMQENHQFVRSHVAA